MSLEEQLSRLEAILRDHHLHEPFCPERKRMKEQPHTGAYLNPRACRCWLSEEEDRIDDEGHDTDGKYE